MTYYRRVYIPGGTFFFTVVTYNRGRFLCLPENIDLLRQAFRYVMTNHPFKIDAMVILPDHLHCIWTLPENDYDFSTRWRLIKSHFSRHQVTIKQVQVSASREQKKEKAVWQHRFWEHLIRDELDYQRHIEYIHYNPVKHGLVKRPIDWEYSSFRRYVTSGIYPPDWGCIESITFSKDIGQE